MSTLSILRGEKLTRTAKIDADKALAGAQIAMMVRRAYDVAPLLSLEVGTGIEITSDVPGAREYTITLESDETEDGISLRGEDLVYDIRIKYADGDGWYYLDKGAIVIGSASTRDE